MSVASLNRTLEQELFALLRRASLECLVCGEFVLRRRGDICCPECGMTLSREQSQSGSGLQFDVQAG